VGPVNHLLDRVPTYSNPLKSSTQVRKTNPTKGTKTPHHSNGQRGIQRGERVRLGGVRDERRPNPTNGLERRTGGQGWVGD